MKRVGALAVAAACAAASSAFAQSLPVGFGWFADMVGSCWVGKFPDGKTVHTHCYTAQFGKFMRGTAALAGEKDGAAHVQFEGDSIYAWDDAGKKIVYYIWGSDGNHNRLEASWSGEELTFPVMTRADPAKVAFRSVWKRIDANSFEVRRERPNGNEWATVLSVTYRRAPLK